MKTAITKGEWIVYGEARKNEFNIWQCKVLQRLAPVARIVGMGYGNKEDEATSNAKLIAAAPDLLEALEGLVNDVKNKPNDSRYATHIIIAEEAIKKATE